MPPYRRIDDATDRGTTCGTEHREPPLRLPKEPPRFLGKQVAFHHTTDERSRIRILTLYLIMLIHPLHLDPTCTLEVPQLLLVLLLERAIIGFRVSLGRDRLPNGERHHLDQHTRDDFCGTVSLPCAFIHQVR